jgi:heterotetrameric sarcosine oxidase gamma subunit
VTDVTISTLPAAPLHALEIWSNAPRIAKRFKAATGFTLSAMGRSEGSDALRLIRFEPTVWLVEGDITTLPAILADDGALTAIGGGIVRIQISGAGWRALLMEGGVFDAENAVFAPGCSAATVIDHIAVRLHVSNEDVCIAYVSASYSDALLKFWNQAAKDLGTNDKI